DGICLAGSGHLIGGPTPEARNVISGNKQAGIRIANAGSTGNRIQGNTIGTNAAGDTALGNGTAGVQIEKGAANNIIGGPMREMRNLISGNQLGGVVIHDAGSTGN